jgi:hypothetical protein
MTKRMWPVGLLVLSPMVLMALGGCNKEASKPEGAKADSTKVAEKDVKKVHDHSGWWCDEHGIPEAECSMCSGKVAKEFKAKGDWCEKHDRAKSQCFICDPSLKKKYAAKYQAKYGKEPPPTEDEEKETPMKEGNK